MRLRIMLRCGHGLSSIPGGAFMEIPRIPIHSADAINNSIYSKVLW